MKISDDGIQAAIIEALRTRGLAADSVEADAVDSPAARDDELADDAVRADPAEALLNFDVWGGSPARYLDSDKALPARDPQDLAGTTERLADHVLAALG